MRRGTRAMMVAWACAASVSAALAEDERYLRVRESASGDVVSLEVEVRTLTRADSPAVHLVGAVHIADAPFYSRLQAFLDAQDVVLYEGVGGMREPDAWPEPGSYDAKRRETLRRLGYVAVLVERSRAAGGALPESVGALGTDLGPAASRRLARSLTDSWGTPIVYTSVEADGVASWDVLSYGADGKAGGNGEAADVSFMGSLSERTAPEAMAQGLQAELASALGLTFQLTGVDYADPSWRNSDMSMEEIQRAISGDGEEHAGDASRGEGDDDARSEAERAAGALFDALSGEGMIGRISGLITRFISASPQSQAIAKLMLMEAMARAEDLMAVQIGGLGDLITVLIDQRNEVVLDDLRAIVEDEAEVEDVAIFYGAGHFPHMERALLEDGWVVEDSFWVPAITVDIPAAGLDRAQAQGMRSMIRASLEMQLRAVERMRDGG